MKYINEGYFKENRVFKKDNVNFFDVRNKPFKIYGLYKPYTEKTFKRLPDEVAKNTNEAVSFLYTNPSGGRIRFRTNSDFLMIKTVMPYISHRSIMSLLCSAGFDIYINKNGRETYYTSINPPIDLDDGYEGMVWFGNKEYKDITLYMPLYNDVSDLHIGINKECEITEYPLEYKIKKPVVFYGSSITQGASASRPGNSYEAKISRKLDCDFINLGFAGAAKGEESISNYMSTLDMSAFVCDYDYNAPTVEHLNNTHEKLYKTIRKTHPNLPYIMLSRPVVRPWEADNIKRRCVVFNTYKNAISEGDKNVYFIDGFSLFEPDVCEDCIADGIHPNDLGFHAISEKVGALLRRVITGTENFNAGKLDERVYY